MNKKQISRRKFIENGVVAGIASAILPISTFSQDSNLEINFINSELEKYEVSNKTKKLLSLLGIKHPIIQAPTGGVVNSTFTAAVSNNGCLGALPLSWSEPEYAIKQINAIKDKTKNPFFANFVLNFEPKAFQVAVDNNVPIIQFSWGMPTKEMVFKMKQKEIVLGVQVTSKDSAIKAIALGADYLVCQGSEAGGHVQATRNLEDALTEILKVAGEVPVAASGGIANGLKIRKYLNMGAAGVVVGSRFVATKESRAHEVYKKSLVENTSKDTVFTTCMNKGWDSATHRILRNSTFTSWETSGCPSIGVRPGENDIIVKIGEDYEVERYSINSPNISYTGNIEAMANYAGMSIDDINDIPTVAELIERIIKELKES